MKVIRDQLTKDLAKLGETAQSKVRSTDRSSSIASMCLCEKVSADRIETTVENFTRIMEITLPNWMHLPES